MSVLVPMSSAAYRRYQAFAASNYADANIASGRWPKRLALGRAKAAYKRLLPKGLRTPDNFLFEVKETAESPTAGIIWYAIVKINGFRSAYLCDIYIYPEFRRQGLGEGAVKALERRVRAQGLSDIALHVFSYNKASQNLWKKLGYEMTSVNFTKRLGEAAAR